MPDICRKIAEIREKLPERVELVAVSKFQPEAKILEAYDCGQRVFGESRVQEFINKRANLPQDIRWHFIGHLQTNKVKQIIGKTYLIESVDSVRLLDLIDAESRKQGVVTNVLLQVHVAREETKFGFSTTELRKYFEEKAYESLTNVHICGLMAMATNTDDEMVIRSDFKTVSSLMNEIREEISPDLRGFDRLSMGMSDDWPIALEEGADIIRIGSGIFGARL